MKYILAILISAFTVGTLQADPPQVQRQVIRPQLAPQVRHGKQDWIRPQPQPQMVQPNHIHGRIIYRPYVHPFYRYSYPVYHSNWCQCYHCCPPQVILPTPVHPVPFQGFFFHFRF